MAATELSEFKDKTSPMIMWALFKTIHSVHRKKWGHLISLIHNLATVHFYVVRDTKEFGLPSGPDADDRTVSTHIFKMFEKLSSLGIGEITPYKTGLAEKLVKELATEIGGTKAAGYDSDDEPLLPRRLAKPRRKPKKMHHNTSPVGDGTWAKICRHQAKYWTEQFERMREAERPGMDWDGKKITAEEWNLGGTNVWKAKFMRPDRNSQYQIFTRKERKRRNDEEKGLTARDALQSELSRTNKKKKKISIEDEELIEEEEVAALTEELLIDEGEHRPAGALFEGVGDFPLFPDEPPPVAPVPVATQSREEKIWADLFPGEAPPDFNRTWDEILEGRPHAPPPESVKKIKERRGPPPHVEPEKKKRHVAIEFPRRPLTPVAEGLEQEEKESAVIQGERASVQFFRNFFFADPFLTLMKDVPRGYEDLDEKSQKSIGLLLSEVKARTRLGHWFVSNSMFQRCNFFAQHSEDFTETEFEVHAFMTLLSVVATGVGMFTAKKFFIATHEVMFRDLMAQDLCAITAALFNPIPSFKDSDEEPLGGKLIGGGTTRINFLGGVFDEKKPSSKESADLAGFFRMTDDFASSFDEREALPKGRKKWRVEWMNTKQQTARQHAALRKLHEGGGEYNTLFVLFHMLSLIVRAVFLDGYITTMKKAEPRGAFAFWDRLLDKYQEDKKRAARVFMCCGVDEGQLADFIIDCKHHFWEKMREFKTWLITEYKI